MLYVGVTSFSLLVKTILCKVLLLYDGDTERVDSFNTTELFEHNIR